MANYFKIGSNLNDKHGMMNILRAYVLGGTDVEEYSQEKVYNKGDKIYITDATGNIIILTASQDGITGPFNIDKWIQGVVGTGGGGKSTIISNTEPTDDNIDTWIKPVATSYHNLPDAEGGGDEPPVANYASRLINIFEGGDIPIGDVVLPDGLDEGDIAIDIESETITDVNPLDYLESPGETDIATQEDISAGDDIENEPNASAWMDTENTEK